VDSGTHRVVYIDFVVRTEDGEVIRGSEPGEPVALHLGSGETPEEFEEAVRDLGPGESADIVVPPEKAFGRRDPEKVRAVSLAEFPDGVVPQAGMAFAIEDEDGTTVEFRIDRVEGDQVWCDFNHPLADRPVVLHVDVVSVEEHDGSCGCGCDDA
jgi:FKBP-type peptidyl-prolyl cis-trans isomerase 2